VEGWDVVDAVGALVAKSMVVAEPGEEEHTRYQLLETLRQYGRERLDEEGQSDRWRRGHAGDFAAFAAEVGRGLRGRDELVWRERLLGDLDNLRTAVVWGLDTGVEEDQQIAVAIIAWLAYESQTRATGIGRWAEQAIPPWSGRRPATAAPRSARPPGKPCTGANSTRRSATPEQPWMRTAARTIRRPVSPRSCWWSPSSTQDEPTKSPGI
jgi:hypothetical protein